MNHSEIHRVTARKLVERMRIAFTGKTGLPVKFYLTAESNWKNDGDLIDNYSYFENPWESWDYPRTDLLDDSTMFIIFRLVDHIAVMPGLLLNSLELIASDDFDWLELAGMSLPYVYHLFYCLCNSDLRELVRECFDLWCVCEPYDDKFSRMFEGLYGEPPIPPPLEISHGSSISSLSRESFASLVDPIEARLRTEVRGYLVALSAYDAQRWERLGIRNSFSSTVQCCLEGSKSQLLECLSSPDELFHLDAIVSMPAIALSALRLMREGIPLPGDLVESVSSVELYLSRLKNSKEFWAPLLQFILKSANEQVPPNVAALNPITLTQVLTCTHVPYLGGLER